jgi:hypothetical protein
MVRIKSFMNKNKYNIKDRSLYIQNIDREVLNLLNKPSPYIIREGRRCKRK